MTSFIIASEEACIGCRTCEIACALEHASAGTEFHPRLKVMRLSEVSVPVMCHQCEQAPCARACPTGALSIGGERIEADAGLCISCQSCVIACPFGAISIEAGVRIAPTIVKCDLCWSRARGPACVDVCPTSALRKMTGQELEALQKRRHRATASPLTL